MEVRFLWPLDITPRDCNRSHLRPSHGIKAAERPIGNDTIDLQRQTINELEKNMRSNNNLHKACMTKA
eukprot:7804486-Heterocapsa_arctica.AAC.1